MFIEFKKNLYSRDDSSETLCEFRFILNGFNSMAYSKNVVLVPSYMLCKAQFLSTSLYVVFIFV